MPAGFRQWTSSLARKYAISAALRGVTSGALPLRVAVPVRVSVRRIWVSLPSVFPRQELFAHSLSRLREEASG